jgi:hypothetical protein
MASTTDMAKLHSIINGWPTAEQAREKEVILQRLARRSSKELKMEREPYGVEEFEEVEDDGEAEDQLDGDLTKLPDFSAFAKLRPTSAKLGMLTPSTSVGESLASLGSFSPCSSFGERLNELDQSQCSSSNSAGGDAESSSSGRTTVCYVGGKFVRTTA